MLRLLLAAFMLTSYSVSAQIRPASYVKAAPQAMTAEETRNLSNARRYILEYLANGDVKVADEVAAPSLEVVTGLSPKAPIEGLANHKKIFLPFVDALPTKSMVIEDSFVAGNRVMIQFNCLTTFKKDYLGVKATGRPIRLKETHVMKFNQSGKLIQDVVSATNLEYEMTFAPVLAPMILGTKP